MTFSQDSELRYVLFGHCDWVLNYVHCDPQVDLDGQRWGVLCTCYHYIIN